VLRPICTPMDQFDVLRLLTDRQVHPVKELIVGRSITAVDLTMIARSLSEQSLIDLRLNLGDPLLRILPLGEQALAAHEAVKKSEIDRQA
jgi:DNA-binding MarR family transcriptional regulator